MVQCIDESFTMIQGHLESLLSRAGEFHRLSGLLYYHHRQNQELVTEFCGDDMLGEPVLVSLLQL